MQKHLLTASVAALALLSACQKPEAPKEAAPAAPAPTPVAPAAPVAVFASQAPAAVAAAGQIADGGQCALDSVNTQPASDETVVTDRNAPLVLSGWSGAEIDGKFPTQTYVLLEGLNTKTNWYATSERSKRPDVVKALGKASFDDAGFNSTANSTPLPADVYLVKTVLVLDNKAVACSTGRRVKFG